MKLTDKTFATFLIICLIILIGGLIYCWNVYPEDVFPNFKGDKYVCDEPCPANLTYCVFEDGTKSWGYCLEWHKRID